MERNQKKKMGSIASRELSSIASRDFRISSRDVLTARFIKVIENALPSDIRPIFNRYEDMLVMYASRFLVFGWDKKSKQIRVYRQGRDNKYEENNLSEKRKKKTGNSYFLSCLNQKKILILYDPCLFPNKSSPIA